MRKKVIVSIAIIIMILILCTMDVLGIRAVYKPMYDETSYIIFIIMKVLALLIIISYIVYAIVYMIKSKRDKNEKLKKLIKWLIITIIISLGLWFGSEKVRRIGMTDVFISNDDVLLKIEQRERIYD